MPSRNVYTSLTPDYADFAVPTPEALPSPSRPSTPNLPELEQSKWNLAVSGVKGFVANNAGLLLVAASQGFFSLMNVAVKKLNSIDPPVPTLEV